MNKLISTFLLTSLFFVHLQAQHLNPSVVYQNGFSMESPLSFELLKGNEFLMGYTQLGEYIFWDLKSNKIVRKFRAIKNDHLGLLMIPEHSVSEDGKKILIPKFPEGGYYLYNIYTDDIEMYFPPPVENLFHSYALFKKDGFILLSQSPDSPDWIIVSILNSDGIAVDIKYITVPKLFENENAQLIVGLMANPLTKVPNLQKVAWHDETETLYFLTITKGIYTIPLNKIPSQPAKTYLDEKYLLKIPELRRVEKLSIANGKLIVQNALMSEKDKKAGIQTAKQKILIIDPKTNLVEKEVESRLPLLDSANYSVGIPFLYRLSNHSKNIYLSDNLNTPKGFAIDIKDFNSDETIATYKSGNRKLWYDDTPYQPGNFNGGYLADISEDQTLMVEYTRDIVIHDIANKTIKSVLPLDGSYRLNAPLFLNKHTLLIPKATNNAFVFNMELGKIDLLNNAYDCLETIRNGAIVKWQTDRDLVFGMRNFSISPDDKYIVGVSFFNDSVCTGKPQKEIILYNKNTLAPAYKYTFEDNLHTWYSTMLPGDPHSFLVNNKLIKFHNAQSPTITDLNLNQKKKKNVYWAHNPVYLKNENKILSVLGTRESPGKKDLIFAFYDLNGKLLEKIDFKRKGTGQEFKTLITESKLSEDQTKLLFTLFDGTGGIFDIPSRKVIYTFEHGKGLKMGIIAKNMHTAITSAAFVNDKQFVTAGTDGIIYLWDINYPSYITQINQELTILYDIQVSPDKKHIIGVDFDKLVKYIDFNTGETVADFLAIDPKTHTIIDKDGYYMTNKYTNDGLWFFSDGKTYEISQFDVRLNRPDKVLRSLGYTPDENIRFFNNAYKKRIQHLGIKDPELTDNYQKMSIPEIIEIKGLPENLQDIETEKLNLTIRSESKKDKIDKIFVTVNGVPVYGTKGKNLDAKQIQSGEVPITIPIVSGKNSITISVMNTAGVESSRSFLNVNRKSKAVKPNLHLISIGSGKFKQSENNLEFPAKDAHDIVELFNQSEMYEKVIPYIYTDEKVVKKNILALKENLKKTRPEDFVIIFFAGHGILDKNQDYYLSAYSTDFKGKINTNSISYYDIEGLMDGIPSLNKLIFLDACFSGEIDKSSVEEIIDANTTAADSNPEKKFNRSSSSLNLRPTNMHNSFELMQTIFSDLRMNTGTTVLASSRGFEKSYEFYGLKNGAFTYSLKQALSDKKADSDGDGSVSISELLYYMKYEVPKITDGDQTPVSRSENFSNNFVIWR